MLETSQPRTDAAAAPHGLPEGPGGQSTETVAKATPSEEVAAPKRFKSKAKTGYHAVILVGDGIVKLVGGVARKNQLEDLIEEAGANEVLWVFKGYPIKAKKKFSL